MTRVQALAALRTCVATLTGMDADTVALGRSPSVPALAEGHVSLVTLSDTGVGYPYASGASEVTQARQQEVQIDAWGEVGCAGLERAHALLRAESPARRTLRTAGVSLQGVDDLLDTSTVDRTAYVPRATCVVRIGYDLVLSGVAPAESATSIVLSALGEPTGDELDAEDVATVPIP